MQLPEKPGVQLALDFHDHEAGGYGGYKCQLLITDWRSELMWDYYLTDHKSETILEPLQHLLETLEHQYQICFQRIKCNNEIFMKRKAVLVWLNSQFVIVELSPLYIKELDEAAEHSGNVIKNNMREQADFMKVLKK